MNRMLWKRNILIITQKEMDHIPVVVKPITHLRLYKSNFLPKPKTMKALPLSHPYGS